MKKRIFHTPFDLIKKNFSFVVGSMCAFYELNSPKMQSLNISENNFYDRSQNFIAILNFFARCFGVKIKGPCCLECRLSFNKLSCFFSYKGPNSGAHVVSLENSATANCFTTVRIEELRAQQRLKSTLNMLCEHQYQYFFFFTTQGVIIHEFLHILSASHEFQRPDRNMFCVNRKFYICRHFWKNVSIISKTSVLQSLFVISFNTTIGLH